MVINQDKIYKYQHSINTHFHSFIRKTNMLNAFLTNVLFPILRGQLLSFYSEIRSIEIYAYTNMENILLRSKHESILNVSQVVIQ